MMAFFDFGENYWVFALISKSLKWANSENESYQNTIKGNLENVDNFGPS